MNGKRERLGKGLTSIVNDTANERFKATFGAWMWGGVILATVMHFALIRFFPPLTARDFSFGVTELTAIDLPLEIEVPPPPEAIARPALPVVAQTALEEDVTIAPTTFEENPVEMLPAPPMRVTWLEDQPTFTPYTVAPSLRDRQQALTIIENKYPRTLQNAGIGGTVVVWAFIDETGEVRNCEIHTSCGIPPLDEAALAAVREFSFRPALYYDKHVPVWVSIPIVFKVESRANK